MYYVLQSEQFNLWFDLSNAGNSTIKHLNQENFYNFAFTYPPLSEQKAIADYLDEKCSEIDATIADKQKQLETLDEYKKSLIFEYVTGKKEVLQ
jgi:type I restriction enzyme S subunit